MLAGGATSFATLFLCVFVLLDASEIDLIYFDNAGQFLSLDVHGFSQSVKQEPGGGLGDSEFDGQLNAADAFARCLKKVHGVEPFMEGNTSVFKDGVCTDGELFAAGVALVAGARWDGFGFRTVAVWTDDAVGPAFFFEKLDGSLLVWEQFEEVEG